MEITVIIKGATSFEEIRQAFADTTPIDVQITDMTAQDEAAEVIHQPEAETPVEPKETGNSRGWHYKTRRTCHKWTQEEDQLVLELANKGVPIKAIADTMQSRFDLKVTPAAIKQRLYKYSN